MWQDHISRDEFVFVLPKPFPPCSYSREPGGLACLLTGWKSQSNLELRAFPIFYWSLSHLKRKRQGGQGDWEGRIERLWKEDDLPSQGGEYWRGFSMHGAPRTVLWPSLEDGRASERMTGWCAWGRETLAPSGKNSQTPWLAQKQGLLDLKVPSPPRAWTVRTSDHFSLPGPVKALELEDVPIKSEIKFSTSPGNKGLVS